jgi:hypothetical protein
MMEFAYSFLQKKANLYCQPAGAVDYPPETGNSAEATEQDTQSIRLSKLVQPNQDIKIFYYLSVGNPCSARGKHLRCRIGSKYRTPMGEMPLPEPPSKLYIVRFRDCLVEQASACHAGFRAGMSQGEAR